MACLEIRKNVSEREIEEEGEGREKRQLGGRGRERVEMKYLRLIFKLATEEEKQNKILFCEH